MTDQAKLGTERGLNKDSGPGTVRRAQLAGIDLATDVADAFAASWKQFRAQVLDSRQVLDVTLIRGSVDAAATFLEGIAKAARQSLERFDATRPSTQPAQLDYERLAKLVAAELRLTQKA